MDFAVCAKTFEDEPAKILVDFPGEVHVEDLCYTGDDGDKDEDWTHFVDQGCIAVGFIWKFTNLRENQLSPNENGRDRNT